MTTIVALRYARAFMLELLKQQDKTLLDKAQQDVVLILDTLNDQALSVALESPVLRIEIKKNIVAALFKDKIQAASLAFLNLILSKRRGKILKEILQEFLNLYREQRGITAVVITTAKALNADNQKLILQQLSQKYPQIEATYKQDAKILGGIIIDIAGRQFNLSVSKQLEQMRRALTH